MDREQVTKEIKAVIVDVLGVPEDKVVESAKIMDDLGADSLDIVELVMAFEEKLNSSIPDDKIESLATVGDAIDFFIAQ